VLVSALLITIVVRSDAMDEPALRSPARVLIWLVIAQVALGAGNLLTLAPLGLQMAHFLVSNAVWVAAVWIWLLTRSARVPQAS
jgi:heme A synthase